jgi:transposase
MQFVHKALDEVRRIEAVTSKQLLHKSRYLWLSSSDKLSDTKKNRLNAIMKQNSSLALAYQMKENMKEFFIKETTEEAEIYLNTWCETALNSGLKPFYDVVKTLKRHWQ